MPKEKKETLEIKKETLIIIFLILIVIIFGFLLFSGNSKRDKVETKTEAEIRREIEAELAEEDSVDWAEALKCTEFHSKSEEVLGSENYQEILSWLSLNRTCAIETFGEEELKEIMIGLCQSIAWGSSNEKWLSYCQVNNIPTYIASEGHTTCNIPANQADEYNRQEQAEKELCITRYK
jgi:hypothetical protein